MFYVCDIGFVVGKNVIDNIDKTRSNGDFGDAGIVLLSFFLLVVSCQTGIGFGNAVCCLDECPSEEFSTAGFWDVSFSCVRPGLFVDGDDTGVSAEFSFVFESGNGMNVSDKVTGKKTADARYASEKLIFMVPAGFDVANEFLVELFCFLFEVLIVIIGMT